MKCGMTKKDGGLYTEALLRAKAGAFEKAGGAYRRLKRYAREKESAAVA